MKKKYQSNLILVFLISILTLYLINAELITTGILEYTTLFFTKLFPTSFLIFTFSSLLINYQLIEFLSKINKKNASVLYITLMSLISGFPSGPKYTKELFQKGYITEKTANHLLLYTHFPNPLFILGPVNLLIADTKITIKLLCALILGNFLTATIFHKKSSPSPLEKSTSKSFSQAISEAVTSAAKTLLIVYGTSLFFYLISVIITHYTCLSPPTFALINGFFDLTTGIFSTTFINSIVLKSTLILLFISLGSISIHIQIKSILADTPLKYKNFLFGRILSTTFSLGLFYLFLKI